MRKGNNLLPVPLLVESEDQLFAWVDFQWIGWWAFGRPDERILHLVPDFSGVPLVDIFPGKHLFPGFIPVLRLDVPDNQPVRHHIYRVILPAGVAEGLAVVVRYGRMGLAIIVNPVWFYPKRPADSVHSLTPSTLALFLIFSATSPFTILQKMAHENVGHFSLFILMEAGFRFRYSICHTRQLERDNYPDSALQEPS
jgi:hypothetical protein